MPRSPPGRLQLITVGKLIVIATEVAQISTHEREGCYLSQVVPTRARRIASYWLVCIRNLAMSYHNQRFDTLCHTGFRIIRLVHDTMPIRSARALSYRVANRA